MTAMSFVDFQTRVLNVERTLAQRILWRVGVDHVDPADLSDEERAIACQLFGDVERIPPSAHGLFALLKGARVGGSLAVGELLVWAALTVPLPTLALGELAFAACVAPDLKLAGQVFRFALGAAEGTPSIARYVTAQDSTGFTLYRAHDRRSVRIEALAASGRGTATRGRSYVAAALDEASFFRDPDSGKVNDQDVFDSILPRIVPGGRMVVLSTAWTRTGLLHELLHGDPERNIDGNFGNPQTCIAAMAPTEVLRPADPQLMRTIAMERARNPTKAAREYDCVPLESGYTQSFLDGAAIDRCVDPGLSAFLGEA